MISEMSAGDVKKYIDSLSLDEQSHMIDELKKDGRKSIEKLAERIEKAVEKYEAELARLKRMQEFENQARNKGFSVIAGLDEAGRGPLMGPVVASAVVLPENCVIEGLDDSKKIPEAKRDQLFEAVMEKALWVGIGVADHQEIDALNILEATKLAMKRAIEDSKANPDYLLIDAVKLTDIHIEQESLIKGDSRSLSIAAASIIAKVTRDRLVLEMDQKYPGYGFGQHKGYGTKAHYDAIEKLGITPVHRRSFLKNILE